MNFKDFDTDLQYSLDSQEDILFDNFYRRVFPQLKSIEFVKELTLQKKGFDKIIELESGKKFYIDEKKRRKDWGDILLEIWSNKEMKKKGWFVTSEADYIVYAFMESQVVYVLPLLLMRMWAWKDKKYFMSFKSVESVNKNYTTVCKAIPTELLLTAIKDIIKQGL